MVKCLPLTTNLSKFLILGWNSTLKLNYFLSWRWTCPCWHSWPVTLSVSDGCRPGEQSHLQTGCAWKTRSTCLHTFRLRASCSTLRWVYSFCFEITLFAGPPMRLFTYFFRLSKTRNLTVYFSLWSFVVSVTSGRCKNGVTWTLPLAFPGITVSISSWSPAAVMRSLKALVPGLSIFFCFQGSRYGLIAYEYWQPYSSCRATLRRHLYHQLVYLFRN